MASKDVAPILAREFVSVKIDWDWMKGARDFVKRSDGKSPGLQWFVSMDGDGKMLIDSIAPAPLGDVALPAKVGEHAYSKAMLERVKRHLTDEDIAKLIKSLEQANKAN